MNYRQKLGYAAWGAAIMLVGMGLGDIVSTPLIAQKSGLLNKIQCSGLTVMDKHGNPAVILYAGDEGGNGIVLFNQAGREAASLHTNDDKNSLSIFDEDAKLAVSVRSTAKGRDFALFDEHGNMMISLLAVKGSARLVTIYDDNGTAVVNLGSFNEFENNHISIHDKAGKTAINLTSNIGGNGVGIYDKAGNTIWEMP